MVGIDVSIEVGAALMTSDNVHVGEAVTVGKDIVSVFVKGLILKSPTAQNRIVPS